MSKYYVFAGTYYYPEGGGDDFFRMHDLEHLAQQEADERILKHGDDWAHVMRDDGVIVYRTGREDWP